MEIETVDIGKAVFVRTPEGRRMVAWCEQDTRGRGDARWYFADDKNTGKRAFTREDAIACGVDYERKRRASEAKAARPAPMDSDTTVAA